ncbi:hypothetical protein [Vitiosangium sp. GDMCC 1.1324]|uniref:hypothetical protein n=1 Tax=Vitiosangium sp. (strain GDMCC 1.1324) TaxID=2138576 RepID=UPI000D37768F|nr:hypothetical protein [Vitiosangium sp. GDMCC 1.1324]PTL77505.1 hypothetical protein DAT35_44735 [Vitiosangium sp. GDMCC 1.1324]
MDGCSPGPSGSDRRHHAPTVFPRRQHRALEDLDVALEEGTLTTQVLTPSGKVMDRFTLT